MADTFYTRRDVLRTLGLLGATGVIGGLGTRIDAAPGRDSRSGRPNILFIMTDDHAVRALSCYGSRINETPNLDRIAEFTIDTRENRLDSGPGRFTT